MGGDPYADMPSCKYYENLHCERPRKCLVHKPPLLRPKKPIHLLKPGLHKDWFGESLRTYCGKDLHFRLQRGGPHIFWDFEAREELQRKGWTHRPIPSTDARYEVFLLRGSSHYELLISTTGEASCKVCMKHVGEPFQVPNKEWDPLP